MPATRSSSRLATAQAASSTPDAQTVSASGGVKRKSATATVSSTVEKKIKKSRTKANATDSAISEGQEAGSAQVDTMGLAAASGDEDTPVPATLTFEFEEGQKHLISIDPRFQDLFDRMPCRPFEHLEQVHPFRALTISILGQQISWKAARSITHKFIRLYDTSIPEEVNDESREQAMNAFPSPHKVANTDPAVLRTAGLSARKGEYVLDLAKRFADGRLSTEKLRSATDEELAKMLIEVKGIGQWTVDMFAIFSLRRPDILPVGDLGVQRGLVRWFLSQHSAAHPYALSPEKVGGASSKPEGKSKATVPLNADKDTLPGSGDAVNVPTEDGNDGAMESVLGETGLLPTPFTPSIKQTLKKAPKDVVPLPAGLSVSVLKSRLDGKKVKGAFLTPQEMTDLTESWKPYRSLAASLLAPLMNAPSFQTLGRPILDTRDICPLSPPSCSQQCIKGISPSTKGPEMSLCSSGTASIKPGVEAAQTTPTACDRQSLKEIGPSTSPSSADIFSLSTTLPPANVLFSNYPPNRQHRRDINSRVRRFRNATAGSPATTTHQPSEDAGNAMQHAVHPHSRDTALSADKSKFSLFNNYDLSGRNYSSHFPENHQLMPDFVDAYQLEDELGAGGYSFVMTARDRSDGYEVAVKFIIKDKVPEHCWITDPAYGKLPMEVVILSYVNHDNIVKCLDVYEDSLYFYMVQELHGSPWDRADGVALDCKWCPANSGGSTSSSSLATPSLSPSASVTSLVNHEPRTPPHVYPPLPVAVVDESEISDDAWNGPTSKDVCQKEPHRRPSYDLFECIEQSEQKRLTEEQARYVFGQVVDAVHYLDSLGIVHRDIKDENVVIDQNLKIKLIDFGSATISDPAYPPPEYEQFFGTAAYASSEILLKKKYRAAPAEVWTLGVLLSYLLAGVSPFPTVRDAVEGRIFLSESLGFKPSEEALDLMRKCLDPDPEARIHINDIKVHPWLCGQQALP